MIDSEVSSHCFFCQRPGKIVCDSPECQEWDRELTADQERALAESTRKAFFAAAKQRCSPERDWQLSTIEKWFYTLKCLVCIWLGWSEPFNSSAGRGDRIEVGNYHYARLYAGWEASWVSVGKGVFRQWWYALESDGDWWM